MHYKYNVIVASLQLYKSNTNEAGYATIRHSQQLNNNAIHLLVYKKSTMVKEFCGHNTIFQWNANTHKGTFFSEPALKIRLAYS